MSQWTDGDGALQGLAGGWKAQVERLTERVAQLEEELLAVREQRDALREIRVSRNMLQAVLDNTPVVMYAKDLEGRILLANREFYAFFGVEEGTLEGRTDYELFPAEFAEIIRSFDRQVVSSRKAVHVQDEVPGPDGPRTYVTVKFPIFDGDVVHALGVTCTDITPLKKAQAAQAALQAQVIDAQRSVIRELLTPLLPIAPGVVAMPLVGAVDSSRAQQILETLLEGIVAHQATIAILDITGVKVVDTLVAQALVRTAQAARLLGAQVVLTGIQPAIAQTLVTLGADLSAVVTHGTLQGGIAHALRSRSRQPPARHQGEA